jgi:hypothetical protein
MKEEQVYLGEGWWPWLGCCSLLFRHLSRTSLQLFQLLCNGQNFTFIGKLAYAITPSLRSMYLGRTTILGRGVLVLVGLLQPFLPLFFQNFSTTFSIIM